MSAWLARWLTISAIFLENSVSAKPHKEPVKTTKNIQEPAKLYQEPVKTTDVRREIYTTPGQVTARQSILGRPGPSVNIKHFFFKYAES